MSEAIIARDLRKAFGRTEAVRGVSFSVHPGECYGLLGPNGAGKTTSMSLIRCVSQPGSGQLKVLGMDAVLRGRSIRGKIGVVPQHDNLDENLTVFDNLLVYASYFGIRRSEARQRADELLKFFALDEKKTVPIQQLSGGMRRRLLLARGLINRPELLILDEPTTGLDPQARHLIWQRLRLLKAEGTTMIMATHYMDEAEQVCDRLSIMDRGQILTEGSPVALIEQHAGTQVVKLCGTRQRTATDLESLGRLSLSAGLRLERYDDCWLCYTPAEEPFPTSFVEGVRQIGLEMSFRRATLEDVFLNLTGRELRE